MKIILTEIPKITQQVDIYKASILDYVKYLNIS